MPEARFTTGEFAAICGTTKATLFHYDKMGVLCPKRDPDNNYRYYTDKQVADFDTISSLAEIGTPLSEIRELRENWHQEDYLELLDRKEREMKEKEEWLRRMRAFLRFTREETERCSHIRGDELEFIQCPALCYAVGPGGELNAQERRRFMKGTAESLRRLRTLDNMQDACVGSIVLKEDVERGRYMPSYYYTQKENASITGGILERPAGTYARFYHVGQRQGVGTCIRDTLPKIRALGWRIAGHVYVDDRLNTFILFPPGRIVFPIDVQVEKDE